MWGAKRDNFHVHLLPYHEQGNIFDMFDWDVPTPMWHNPTNSPRATGHPIPSLLCPSDGRGGALMEENDYRFSRLNYFGVFGGETQGELSYLYPSTDYPSNTYPSGAPAPHDETRLGVFDANRKTSIRNITDGTSNTMCIAEGLTGPTGQAGTNRGFVFSDQPGGAFIFTKEAPNSRVPDVLYPVFRWCPGLKWQEPDLPCVTGNWTNDVTTDHTCAARSRHPGGVQALMADGSARFINETIDSYSYGHALFPGTWQKLATIGGGEVLQDF